MKVLSRSCVFFVFFYIYWVCGAHTSTTRLDDQQQIEEKTDIGKGIRHQSSSNQIVVEQPFTHRTEPAKKTEWTFLIYMQANNNLSPFALKNFKDMVTIGSNDKFSLIVQWLQPTQKGVWRYKIEKEKMVLEMFSPIETDGNSAYDLVDAMRWTVTNFPANKYGLILWDHGIGIIDPSWGKHGSGGTLKEMVGEYSSEIVSNNNPRIQIDGLTYADVEELEMLLTATVSLSLNDNHRGILFNEQSRTYMDNGNLSQALKSIYQDVLHNRKIDFLGMDACLMAMTEVGYLAHQYAEVLVGSQEVELAHGWPYELFLQPLVGTPIEPRALAVHLVSMFEAFYKDKAPFYTQSAIDLNCMNLLKESLNNTIKAYNACKLLDNKFMTSAISSARKQCIQFSMNYYVDLYSFLSEFEQQMRSVPQSGALVNSKSLQELKSSLNVCMHIIDKAVLAKTAGKKFVNAKGLSIYFPQNGIDLSYPKTDFAHDCLWYSFIEEYNKPVQLTKYFDLLF